MNAKTALATTKQKLKKHAPYIIAAASTAITIATVVYFNTKTPTNTLEYTDEDIAAMKSGDSNLSYWIDGDLYDLSCRGANPTED